MVDPAGSAPPLRAAHRAPRERTLVDVFEATVQADPDAPALDNGAVVLTYAELDAAAREIAADLQAHGIGPGDRVGVRISSGTTDLYTAILGVLLAGAAYVPLDVDDPESRARLVFEQADVAATIGERLSIDWHRTDADPNPGAAELDDDAWIIFTSGSTGLPKGVAVTHRSAAAFVDAEAGLFLPHSPLGPTDRVMAGLSVAFDASCEEMWLAWRHGACLVPAPRSLVKTGTDLGPWLVANDVTVVSTVPTLAMLWPTEALDRVRLLILGGEACPPQIGERLATDDREVWNTYGPTEATVVACAARVHAGSPVRIGLPLDGWDLAVVDESGHEVPDGTAGELVIGGVGLARYLDADKDAEKYAPLPSLGWDRAYRSGDRVTFDGTGLVFAGRLDEQVKLGGRRIELGEIDHALQALPGVRAAAAAIRTSRAGNQVLVGYLTGPPGLDLAAATERLRSTMPAALVPRLALVDDLPTRTSGKVDRDALPWPLATEGKSNEELGGTAGDLQSLWDEILGARPSSPTDDFFVLGGGSLTAAQLVARLRDRWPETTVAHVYEHPRLADLAASLDGLDDSVAARNDPVPPVRRRSQVAQVVAATLLRTITGLRWTVWIAVGCRLADAVLGWSWLPQLPWWAIGLGWLLLVTPPGRMVVTAGLVRVVLRGIEPGQYPRGGRVHLRLWLAERIADEVGAASLAGAPWMTLYARLLGARIGRDVDLHTVPPVTGMLRLGRGSSIEAEVDLSGHWLDGRTLHLGRIEVGKRARVGVRSTLAPGSSIGADAEIAAGSAVFGTVPAGASWAGAPAQATGRARGPIRDGQPRRRRGWTVVYAATAVLLSALPLVAVLLTVLAAAPLLAADDLGAALTRIVLLSPVLVLLGFAILTVLVMVVVRVQSIGLVAGVHPVQGPVAWRAWTIVRVLDEARGWLFPLYSSTATPGWLRALGADVGADVEASTVLLIPSLTQVKDGAFLADDTMLGMYELGRGWLRIEPVRVGRRAFVGNSGMTAPGRKVPKGGLVAVLSAAPQRTKAKAGTSWLGSPPVKLRRRESETDQARTHRPPRRLRVARALWEMARVVPLTIGLVLAATTVAAIVLVADSWGWATTAALSGLVLAGLGLSAGLATAVAKWLLVGRVRVGEHPLWSSFVWRNELTDTFTEYLAAPWLARPATGTPVLNVWLRTMGAHVGRGVWCDTYWLPEADLVRLSDGATVNRGCVVQTHLFHDRILSMDSVTVHSGATLGPHGVALPASSLGRHATIGPASLVMRGESVPARTRWIGNPIAPWPDDVPAGTR